MTESKKSAKSKSLTKAVAPQPDAPTDTSKTAAKSKKSISIEQLKEMVRARSKIQPELIRLLEFEEKYREELAQRSLYLRVIGSLASAGFSLWRAAFLFQHEEGLHEEYLENVSTFIAKIASTNSIAFMDDQNTWSLWHYIGSARSSLIEVIRLLKLAFDDPQGHAYAARLSDPPLLSASAAWQWDELFEVMQFTREKCASQLDEWARDTQSRRQAASRQH